MLPIIMGYAMDQQVETLFTLLMKYLSWKVKMGKPAKMTVYVKGKELKGGGMPLQEKDGNPKFDPKSPKPFVIVFVEGESPCPLENLVTREPTRSIIKSLADRLLKGGTLDFTELVGVAKEIYGELEGMPPHTAILTMMKKIGDYTGEKISINAEVAPVKAIAEVSGKKKEFNEESLLVTLSSSRGSLRLVVIPRNVAAKISIKQAERWLR